MTVPKVLGADVELGNFVEGVVSSHGSGAAASKLLLARIDGIPASIAAPSPGGYGRGGTTVADAQDWGRKFLPANGACAYIDLDHLEIALPEVRSAFDHVAYWRAMLQVARTAAAEANRRLPAGCHVYALANCSDGHGHSYGAHTNVLLTRTAWDNIIRRKPHYLAYLIAFQVSSIVFTGAGKVGSENGRPWADFQLTQRGDFLETILGEQTTYRRPLVNGRDEPLCAEHLAPDDGDVELARLHVIFFDPTLCQVATLLRAGTLQIVTAMIEAGFVSPALALDDPLDALQRWGHDPSLAARARLVERASVTAVELQQRFLEEARRFAQRDGFDGIVPRAAQILDLWEDTLGKLRERDVDALARRLDWVLKRRTLERAMASRPSLSWSSHEIRHLDQMFASVDEGDGLFWALERAGLVDTVIGQDQIDRAGREPPEDTRAWTRAHLLRRAGAARVESVDWNLVGVRLARTTHWYAERRTVYLPRPYGATRAEHEALFAGNRPVEEIVEALQPDGTPMAVTLPTRYLC